MKAPARQVVLILCSLALLVSCSKNNAPPLVEGQWEVDYESKGSPFIGNVTFSQTGASLTGDGADQDGNEWQVDAGQIQGTQVAFGKKYANSTSPPIIYTGELKYLQLPEYTGWAMEGTYSATDQDGNIVSGKWIANPTAPPQ
jgi:major membrane immunogen (membrane-anchored lipoprotein)